MKNVRELIGEKIQETIGEDKVLILNPDNSKLEEQYFRLFYSDSMPCAYLHDGTQFWRHTQLPFESMVEDITGRMPFCHQYRKAIVMMEYHTHKLKEAQEELDQWEEQYKILSE